jgi:hypothetical protein
MARRHTGVALGGECDGLGVRPVGIQLLLTADPGAEIAAPKGPARHGIVPVRPGTPTGPHVSGAVCRTSTRDGRARSRRQWPWRSHPLRRDAPVRPASRGLPTSVQTRADTGRDHVVSRRDARVAQTRLDPPLVSRSAEVVSNGRRACVPVLRRPARVVQVGTEALCGLSVAMLATAGPGEGRSGTEQCGTDREGTHAGHAGVRPGTTARRTSGGVSRRRRPCPASRGCA